MKSVVKNVAVVKKALGELAKIEGDLEARIGSLTVDELEFAKREIVKFAKIIARNSKTASNTLKLLKKDVEAYRKELLDAAG